MLFTLEALRAEAGDCLLLHYGDPDEPRLIVVDGGPTIAVYERLRDRLDELRRAGGFTEHEEPLPIELVMVSHVDDDHIDGIIRVTEQLLGEAERSYRIKSMWHNSFDDVIGNGSEEFATAEQDDGTRVASVGGSVVDPGRVRHDTALVLASINQGRTLRDNAKRLGLKPPLLVAEADERPRNFGDGLTLRVVGPLRAQLDELHEEWEKHLEKLRREGKLDEATAASFSDDSAANLASLVVLAEADGKTMLLTGDARADFLAESLRGQNLLDGDGRLHVDLFKLPHHGSDRNVERSTFSTVTADHYVISGDGKHGNPEVDTFRMLFGGRADAGMLDEKFTLHLTYAPEELRGHDGHDYPVAELNEVLDQARRDGHDFDVVHPAAGEEGVTIEL